VYIEHHQSLKLLNNQPLQIEGRATKFEVYNKKRSYWV